MKTVAIDPGQSGGLAPEKPKAFQVGNYVRTPDGSRGQIIGVERVMGGVVFRVELDGLSVVSFPMNQLEHV